MYRHSIVVLWLLSAVPAAAADAGQWPPAGETGAPAASGQTELPAVPETGRAPANPSPPLSVGGHRLGPHDVVAVSVLQAPELNATVRVSEGGEISLPLLGSVQAGGLTPSELENSIEAQLRAKYIRNPDVTVSLTELHSQPVSVMGAVKRPGIYQLQGAGTLLEALALAGGLAENAGDKVMVQRTRAAQPHQLDPACAAGDASRCAQVLEIDLKELLASRNPALNIPIRPGDVVAVQSAAVVYVVGAVTKPGSFFVGGNDGLTVLRALALGGGATPLADLDDAVVLRGTDSGDRVEIPVDLEAILKGRTADLPLEAQDVLFVPTSGAKMAARATVDTLLRLFTFRVIP